MKYFSRHKYIIFLNKRKGFSIFELLIGISIMGIIGLAMVFFQRDMFFFNRFISGNLVTQDEIRRTFKGITPEIRSLSPSNIGAYPIAEANSTSFIFYSDIDDDSLKERIRYFLDGNILKKGVIKPSGSPLSYNLGDELISELIYDVVNGSTSVFEYYDENYDGTTLPIEEPINISLIRLVKITVLVNKNPSQFSNIITLTTQVSMRNLKDNL